MDAVVAEGLTKVYRFHRKPPGLTGALRALVHREWRETRAVDGLSFRIAPGEMVGFLGPNGAGKTTTLKCCCGLLYPTAGRVTVLGHTPARRAPAYLRQIALVMGQKNMLWWDLPALDTLLLQKEIYRLDGPTFTRTVDELAALLDVTDLLRVQVRKLSLGERMKLELLAALVHRPAVLFLDEPTLGLDVIAQQRVHEFLRRLNREQGTTVLLTSHYMADIEELCPRVLVIAGGKLVFDGGLHALVAQAAPHKVLRAIYADPVPPDALAAALGPLAPAPGSDPRQVEVAVPRAAIAGVTADLLRLGPVVDLSVEEAPVEAIVRDLFRAAAAPAPAPEAAP